MFKTVFIIAVAAIVLYGGFVFTTANKSEHFITINYFDHRTERTEFATKVISQDANCITFINMFGMEQTVCAQNISITKFK